MPTPMCPGCRALLAPEESTCPYCGWNIRQTEVRKSGGFVDRAVRPFGGLVPALIFANLLVYVAGAWVQMRVVPSREPGGPGIGDMFGALLHPAGKVLVLLGGNMPVRVLEGGEVWRLLAATLLHLAWWHILMNMWVLKDIGGLVEEAYGAGKTFVLYTLAGIAGNVATLGWRWFLADGRLKDDYLGVGASGAILGLAGILAALGLRIGGEQGRRLWGPILKWVAILFGLGIFLAYVDTPFGRIDNTAHAGGFLLGMAAGFLCSFGIRARGNPDAIRLWDIGAVLCALLSVAAFLPPALRLLRG